MILASASNCFFHCLQGIKFNNNIIVNKLLWKLLIIVTKDCTVFILAFHTFVQRLIHTVELPLTATSLQWPPLYNGHLFWQTVHTLAGVTLQTFYLGKLDLLTVYLGKIDFLSVTDFSRGNFPWGNFIVWGLDMSQGQQTFPWQLPQSDSLGKKKYWGC